MAETDCIFCKIIAGDIPSTKVYEDDRVVAFEDVAPKMPVHVLVVPKEHHESLAEVIPADTLSALLDATRKVAEAKGVAESGFRVVSNAGPDSMQEVAHLHLHVLGGAPMNDGNPSKDAH